MIMTSNKIQWSTEDAFMASAEVRGQILRGIWPSAKHQKQSQRRCFDVLMVLWSIKMTVNKIQRSTEDGLMPSAETKGEGLRRICLSVRHQRQSQRRCFEVS